MRFSSSHFCLKLKWTYTLLCIGFCIFCVAVLCLTLLVLLFFFLAFWVFVIQIITNKYIQSCSINFESVERLVSHHSEGTQTEWESAYNDDSMGILGGFERFRLEISRGPRHGWHWLSLSGACLCWWYIAMFGLIFSEWSTNNATILLRLCVLLWYTKSRLFCYWVGLWFWYVDFKSIHSGSQWDLRKHDWTTFQPTHINQHWMLRALAFLLGCWQWLIGI